MPAATVTSSPKRALEAEHEDARRRKRRERQRADVEEHAVDLLALCAPLDDADRHGEDEGSPGAEERGSGERADGADRDRAVIELERERLPHADERDHGEQPDHVRGGAEDRADDARGDADGADEPDEHAETQRELKEPRAAGRVRRVPPLLLREHLGDACERLPVIALLGHGDEPLRAVGRHQQRLGAGAQDAVSPLQLRPVDGEVGLMDERVRVLCVLREAGDADRDGGADRLARRLDVVELLGDGATNALGDLHRLLGRRLGKQDRELLAAETGRDVVVAQFGPEDLGDPLQHGVAGEMAVRVVDLAEQVEVGHDQRQRPLEALRAPELLRKRRGEVARVEEPRLRIDAGLRLQLRHRERPVDQQQRRDRERDEPWIAGPERGEDDAEGCEDEFRRERLVREQLAHRMTVDQADHGCDQRRVEYDEDDRRRGACKREADVVGRDQPVGALDEVCRPPRRHRRDREHEDVRRSARTRCRGCAAIRGCAGSAGSARAAQA